MVKATPLKRVTPDHAATPTWLAGVAARESPAAAQTLREVLAYVTPLYADHTLPHGEPVFAHVLGAAPLLDELHLGHEAVAAALLWPALTLDAGAARR